MIRRATIQDVQAITNIYNVYVQNSVATFETEPVTLQEMHRRVEEISSQYPFLVYEKNGKVLGYCYAHKWKARTAYDRTLETTVYVATSSQRKGIGKEIMVHLIEKCRQTGAHVLVACITSGNENSVRLHRQLGFQQVSHFRQVGMKFARWLDVIDFQLLL